MKASLEGSVEFILTEINHHIKGCESPQSEVKSEMVRNSNQHE